MISPDEEGPPPPPFPEAALAAELLLQAIRDRHSHYRPIRYAAQRFLNDQSAVRFWADCAGLDPAALDRLRTVRTTPRAYRPPRPRLTR